MLFRIRILKVKVALKRLNLTTQKAKVKKEINNYYSLGSSGYLTRTGNWGVLGNSTENSVKLIEPYLVDYFVKNNIKVKKVCMGDFHTMVLSEDGDVYTWGYGGKPGFLNILFRGNQDLLDAI